MYAAAWKTNSGSYSSKIVSNCSLFLTSTITGIISKLTWFNSKVNWCKGVSAWSNKIIFDGEKGIICRTISLPIEPAAPVISMTLFETLTEILIVSKIISSLFSKSWISKVLILLEMFFC